MTPLNILVLHGMAPKEDKWFAGVADVELRFPKYAPDHHYLIHNSYYPIPEFLKIVPFDAIFLMSTFIDRLTRAHLNGKQAAWFSFLKEHPSIKIAFPQDDYWFSEVRDHYYLTLGINKVYPVCPSEYWHELIPKYLASGRPVSLGYTTYVTNMMRRRGSAPRNWNLRQFDVVYRAKQHPTAPNRFGVIKGIIGERFKTALGEKTTLRLNISTDAKDVISGNGWLDFVENSKAILGSNSGSSILLRNHRIYDAIKRYTLWHPDADFNEIELKCLPEADRLKEYTAISPRNIEAALLETLQILVPGTYSGILTPYEHYLPLHEDCSNIDEVISILNDQGKSQQIARRCRKKILETKEIQIETSIEEVFESISTLIPSIHRPLSNDAFKKISEQYDETMRSVKPIVSTSGSLSSFLHKLVPPSFKQKIRKTIGKYL